MEENCLAPEAYRLRHESPNFSMESRRLLRFTTSIQNIGDADFRPFIPKTAWEWHACHMHYHSMEVRGHSTTTWAKFDPNLTPSPLGWTSKKQKVPSCPLREGGVSLECPRGPKFEENAGGWAFVYLLSTRTKEEDQNLNACLFEGGGGQIWVKFCPRSC